MRPATRTMLLALACLGSGAAAACPAGDDVAVDVPRDVPAEIRDGDVSDGPCGPSGECDAGTCCPTGCKDLRTDPDNCGECGNRCLTDEVCERGFCYTPECNPECSPSMLCCRGDCVDFLNDEENCGDCGHACPAGLACSGGTCLCGTSSCGAAEECCDGACVDTLADPDNCGRCGAACGAGLPCNSGRCVCGDTECPTGWSCCDGECADLQGDMDNCGRCDSRCDPTRSSGCVEGYCMCGSESQCSSGSAYPLCHSDPWLPSRRCCSGACETVNEDACSGCGIPCSSGMECQASVGLFSCEYSCGWPSG